MTIKADVPHSPGWWLAQAMAKRAEQRDHLDELASWQDGDPPAPTAVRQAREEFREFEEEARTNFAELITGSLRERIAVRDVKTGASGDVTDNEAMKHYRGSSLDVEFASWIETMLWAGSSYMIVGDVDEDDTVPATAEDPRDVVTFHDPVRQSRILSATKIYTDVLAEEDVAVVWIRGVKGESRARQHVARRPVSESLTFNADEWSWDEDQGGEAGLELKHHLVPVVRLRNRNDKGEFEPHLNILRRINRLTFQMQVIVLYQAFKQRAIQLDEKVTDVEVQQEFERKLTGGELDDVLDADPGSWFLLPAGAKVWESTQADIQGILSAIKDDVKRLSAVSRRPLGVLAPDNQSGTAAGNDREQMVFAIRDKITRITQGVVDLFHLIFLTVDDQERAAKDRIRVGWKPFQWDSITDSANATAQVKDVLPLRTILRVIWHMAPEEIDQVLAEQGEDALLFGLGVDDGGEGDDDAADAQNPVDAA